MKLAIVSDIHANLEALRAVSAEISAHAVDRIVCLGDIVGYNTNPAECIAVIRQLGAICIAGNHDRAATGQITTAGFSHTAARAIAWTRARLDTGDLDYLRRLPLTATVADHLVAVHGALHPETGCEIVRLETDELRRQSFAALIDHPSRARICAFGHTHRLGIFEFADGTMRECSGDEVPLRDGAYYLINPGAVGQPRTADRRASFLILDTTRQVVTVHRVSYDAAAALAKTRRAGLMPAFSFLPSPVRNSLKWAVNAVGLSEAVKRIAR
jgi:diadenosine tetraphosphatase ApaH/serine/threonine PP2A family protein phosphatase